MTRQPARIAGLSHRYGARLALDGVSLNVAPGGFACCWGPMAPARARCCGLLTRLLACQSGAIELFGQPLSARPWPGWAWCFSSRRWTWISPSEQNLAYFAALHGLRGSERRARIDAELQRMALVERRRERRTPAQWRPPPPGGNRPRPAAPPASVAAGRSHRRPGRRRGGLVEHVHRLAREEGLAVLWATHLIDEVRADDHIALLHQGRLLASGVAGELTAQAECDSLAQWFDRQTGKEDSACLWP